MWSLPRLVVFLLVGALALTSQELARARGEGLVSGTMVLCIGGTMAVVPMGPDGQPVGPAHVCPDGVLAVAGPPPAVTAPMRAEVLRAFVPAPPPEQPEARALRPVPQARGPPFPV